jgi:hypothetical protein
MEGEYQKFKIDFSEGHSEAYYRISRGIHLELKYLWLWKPGDGQTGHWWVRTIGKKASKAFRILWIIIVSTPYLNSTGVAHIIIGRSVWRIVM